MGFQDGVNYDIVKYCVNSRLNILRYSMKNNQIFETFVLVSVLSLLKI